MALESGSLSATIRAARIVLDRCGLGPASKVELETEPARGLLANQPDYLDWMPRERHMQMLTWEKQILDWHGEAMAAMEVGEPRPNSGHH